MLYIPYPFKQCTKCGRDLLPTLEHFHRHKMTKDRLNPVCRSCRSAEGRAAYQADPERFKQRNWAWNKAHPKQMVKYSSQWAKTHREQHKRNKRNWYRSNPDKIDREKRRQNNRAWSKNNPSRANAKTQRRRAARRGLPVRYCADDWDRAVEYFDDRCAVCGRPRGLWHTLAQDHWIPLTDPMCPGTVPENIVPLCNGLDGCNNSKGGAAPEQWLIWKFGPRKAEQILKRIADYFEWTRTSQHCD